MKKNFKEQIISLRKEGKKIREIQEILQCSWSTISYHLYDKTRHSTKQRTYKNRKKYPQSKRSKLFNKYYQFFRIGHYANKSMTDRSFSFDEFIKNIPERPICYLSGEELDLMNTQSFSLDHKIPSTKGGSNEIHNLGLCSWVVNRCKNDLTPEEFIELCKKVLSYNGYQITKKL